MGRQLHPSKSMYLKPETAPGQEFAFSGPYAYALPPIGKRLWRIGLLGLSILALAVVPWLVPATDVEAHNILHHLNFLPFMAAGMLYGWRGALISTFCAGVLQLPHLLAVWNVARFEASDQIVEMSIFGAAGLIAGFLADRERRHRLNLEKTTLELERVYQELQQNIERLRKAERLYAAGQLSASLAHEIRNPLASISGAAGILKRGHANSEKFHDCLEIIEKESQRLNKLLTQFLEFARPRAPRLQPSDLKEIIDSVTLLAGHSAPFAASQIRIEVPENLPQIRCDPEQLKQVLLNLLINAIQATPEHGLIQLTASAQKKYVVVSIRDQGSGIDPEQRDRIFDPFFTTKENGTGLGLAIASKIVAQHGGALIAESNPDKGMTFRLELPLEERR
jgi:two-component system, NtrC family, sensor histidine kinase HydH